MKISDLQSFLRELGVLLTANQGGKPAAEFAAFCNALEPFKEQSIGIFGQFLLVAAEYQRTGVIPVLAGGRSQGRKRAAANSSVRKQPLKRKDDVRAVEEAVACLQQLYSRATEPMVTHESIEADVDRIDGEFDAEGLKAIARGFGIKGKLSGKGATKSKILSRITERKGRHERGEVISEVAKRSLSEPAPEINQADMDVIVE